MAFNFIPKSVDEIAKANLKNESEYIKLYGFLLSKAPSIKDPIAIDKSKTTSVKVLRDFNGPTSIPELKKITSLNITWGSGSRGGRGAQNRGNLFEYELANDFNEYLENNLEGDFKYKKLVTEIVNHYGLDRSKRFVVVQEGALNKARPLAFSGSQPIIKDLKFDIGSTITDITLKSDNRNVYLSCKYGGTVTFFNIGIKKYLKKEEIITGDIKNVQGKILLETLGIDPNLFCRVFNEYGKGKRKEIIEQNVTSKINKSRLSTLLKSGIGFGYHMVHKIGSTVNHYEMTERALTQSTSISSVVVRYPIADSKRVDATIETPSYSFKLNIRDTSGSVEPYPSHMLMEYKHK